MTWENKLEKDVNLELGLTQSIQMKDHFSFVRIVEVLMGDVVGHHSALDHRLPPVHEMKLHSHQRVRVARLEENAGFR